MSPNPERPVPNAPDKDPLLGLHGSGKHLWADEHADEYINRLRDDWYNDPARSSQSAKALNQNE